MASGLRHTLVSWAQPTRGINITAGAQLRRTQSSPVQCNAASVKSGQECNESFPNVQRAFPTTLQGQFPTWWRRGASNEVQLLHLCVFFRPSDGTPWDFGRFSLSVANPVDWPVSPDGLRWRHSWICSLSLTIPQTLTLIMHKSKNTEKEKFSH